jgi:hypothetical protein
VLKVFKPLSGLGASAPIIAAQFQLKSCRVGTIFCGKFECIKRTWSSGP